MHYCLGASCYQALVCPAVNFSLSSTAALSWNKSVGELTYLVIPMASCVTPRGGLAIGRTGTIPGGLAANLACYPTFYFFIFLLLFMPADCILKWLFPNSPFNNTTPINHESASLLGWQRNSPRARSAHPRVRQKDARLKNGVEAPRWSREAKLSCLWLQVQVSYICK